MRICVIGTGYIGPVNTRALLACQDVQIAGVANRTKSKAESMCRELGLCCPVYSDWRVMLDEIKPEAAVICLFNDLHCDCFLDCAQRGIHILVEKPLGNTYEECIKMMAAAEKYGIKATVLQTQRYGAVLQTANAYIETHRDSLGRLLSVNDRISCDYFWIGRNPWHLDDRRSGGGIVMNYGVHQLDRILWLMGARTARIHHQYLREKEGIATVSSYTMMGVTQEGIPYTAACNGYSEPWVNELDLAFERGLVRCVLTDNGQASKGVYAGTAQSESLAPVDLVCSDGEGGHLMYVRQMQQAMSYLSGKRCDAPISLAWAAELVRLCQIGFEA